jgi:hypothetical protein
MLSLEMKDMLTQDYVGSSFIGAAVSTPSEMWRFTGACPKEKKDAHVLYVWQPRPANAKCWHFSCKCIVGKVPAHTDCLVRVLIGGSACAFCWDYPPNAMGTMKKSGDLRLSIAILHAIAHF